MTKQPAKTTTPVRAKSSFDYFKEDALSIGFFQTMDDVKIMSDHDALASIWKAVGSDLKQAMSDQTISQQGKNTKR